MSDRDFIPLLSGRPLDSFTPAEFKQHVRGLHKERRIRKTAKPKTKKMSLRPVRARLLKKGTISLTTSRAVKYLTSLELTGIAVSLNRGENEIFIRAKELGFSVMSHEDAEAVVRFEKELPF